MYSANSPVLSSLDVSPIHHHANSTLSSNHTTSLYRHEQTSRGNQCLRFKYFIIFIISTTCLILLSGSLVTHKWIISKPTRVLKLNGGQTNLTSLMLTAHSDFSQDNNHNNYRSSRLVSPLSTGLNPESQTSSSSSNQNNKFQGEIYLGLFKGVKVLNYGFGDRVSQISVLQAYFAKDKGNQQELINFKLWSLTVTSVVLAIIFALTSSIFAIINFVMTPSGTLTGPVGLVIWNASACFSSLLAIVTWLIEYFVRLQANVLTLEEVQNGWTSESRSQFGYSYYLVVAAFVLHLVNIFIVSIVQLDKAAKRQPRQGLCEGVIMLY